MLKIGDFAKISQVTPRTLRLYDQIVLLKPLKVEGITGYRYYSMEQLPRLNRILALKDLGLSLEQIERMLADALSAEEIRGMLRLKRVELLETVEAEQERLARVETRLWLIEKEGAMPDYEIVVKEIETLRVAEGRAVAPTHDEIGPLIKKLFDDVVGYIHQHKGNFAGPGFSVYHVECEEMQNDIEVGAAFPIEGPLPEGELVKVYDLVGGSMACVVHHGPFEGLQGAYEALGHWIESNGYQVAGPTREVYLQYHPHEDPADFVTEIQFPIEKV